MSLTRRVGFDKPFLANLCNAGCLSDIAFLSVFSYVTFRYSLVITGSMALIDKCYIYILCRYTKW